MKKNRMMRLASVLLVLCLLTTSVISGTFAKYTTSIESEDSARVAKWGFGTATIDIEELFDDEYTNVAAGSDEQAIIAPGTSGEVSFKFACTTAAPEVAYTFTVATTGSSCATEIQKNTNITWTLLKGEEKIVNAGTWTALINAIEALDQECDAGEVPAMVNTEYTVQWNWAYEVGEGDTLTANDKIDTDLGDLAVTADQIATLKITITATQEN